MLESGLTIGRYRVENQLGAGGMGEVYRAWDSVLQRWIALKVVPQGDSRAARLLGEARAAAALRHPNIVSVYDVGEEGGYAFVSMDLVEGKPLRDWVGVPEMREGDKLAWLLQIASALRAAHKAGLVHRDMKPDNVMITTEGEARVLDFGLAKSFSVDVTGATAHADSKTKGFQTQEGRVSGTPAYMAPEQLAGGPPSPSWDQYAWGVLACELLAGEHPRVAGLISVSGWVKPESLASVPTHVAEVVARAMAPSPDQRFPSMDAVAAALGAPPSGPSPYAIAASNPPAPRGSTPSTTTSAQIGDTLQVPIHPKEPPPQATPRRALWVIAALAVVAASVLVGTKLRAPVVAATTTAPVTSSAPIVAQTAPPSANPIASSIASAAVEVPAAPTVSAKPAAPVLATPVAPRKLNVSLRGHANLQYDVRTIESLTAGVRPLVKACIEQNPPRTIPANYGVDLELWSIGDEEGKVRDVRVGEPPALSKCLYDAFIPLSFGRPKDPKIPPGAVFVTIAVDGS